MATKNQRRGDDTGNRVSVSEEDGGITIRIKSKRLQFDAQLLEECVNSALACAETNACLDQGLKLTDRCALTLVGHHLQEQCITRGFGLAGTKRGAA
jgi:hypothetical protein